MSGIQCTSCNVNTHEVIVYLKPLLFFPVNSVFLDSSHTHLDSKREAVHGESIGKAVRDIMRLSSGLKYLQYVHVVFKAVWKGYMCILQVLCNYFTTNGTLISSEPYSKSRYMYTDMTIPIVVHAMLVFLAI